MAGLLDLCQQSAKTVVAGSSAFATWLVAHQYGWQAARRRTSRATWYRHLSVLRNLGVPVPEGDEPEEIYHKAFQESAVSALPSSIPTFGWFGAANFDQVSEALVQQPARLMQLLNKRFEVVQPWKNLGMRTDEGSHVLEAWPVGTVGVVCQISFNTTMGWEVLLEHSDPRVSDEELYPEVQVSQFLRCTVPLEPEVSDGN